MPTYYMDFEGGNDANTGLSFAQRWKTFANGPTAARTAPGDTIRVMASPDPTLVGNATWTNGPRPSSVTVSSVTGASPIVVTTSAAHGLVTGDYVAISGNSGQANGVWLVGTTPTTTSFQILKMDGSNTQGFAPGSGGSATKATNCMVKLASAVTQNIALCGGEVEKPDWVGSANVFGNINFSLYKEGYTCAEIQIGAAFTTGKAAYYQLPSTLNLSAYQQVSFWVRQSSGTLGAAGAVSLRLCSDTAGNTVVNTINIPALGALNTWLPVVVDTGGALGSSIQSVALYVTTDNGAQSILIDNIIACKAPSSADSLNLTSLVSKSNGSGDEAWYAIQSINGTAVMLANRNSLSSTSPNIRGYLGTTGTVSTYKRETIKLPAVSAQTTTSTTFNESGSSGSPIAYSGGWNRTDMSTQTGMTWYDGQNGLGRVFFVDQFDFLNLERLCGTRFYAVAWSNNASTDCRFISMYATANDYGTFYSGINHYANLIWVNNNRNNLYVSNAIGVLADTVKNCANAEQSCIAIVSASSCSVKTVSSTLGNTSDTSSFAANVYLASTNFCSIGNLNSNGAAGYAIFNNSGFNTVINGGSSINSTSGGVSVDSGAVTYLNDFTINETTEVNVIQQGAIGVYSNRHDNTDNNSWVFGAYGAANQQTAVVDSPATTSWRMRPTSTSASAQVPIRLKIGTVVCAASSLVTITARMRRDNTGLTMRLVCPGGQILGVTSDVTSDMTAAANTWETVTITFTPTKAGAVDIYAYAFGGSTFSGYVCNLTASQA